MAFQHILYDTSEGSARITLNRPEKLNAISPTMLAELNEALWDADEDTAVHAVSICGAGRAFCSGYDLAVPRRHSERDGRRMRSSRSFDDDAWQLERSQRLRMVLFDMHKPVIAQVHGYCLAGGADLATLCDMVICADDAKFGFPAARDFGSLPNQMWLYHIGPQWAKRLLLTGDTVTGVEAAQIGLALKSVPYDDLAGEVEQLLERLALIDSDLLSANKRIVNIGLELMGARTLQRMAAENDARAHQSDAASHFRLAIKEHGLKAALRERDAKFGDGRARVYGPERRDERGCLIDD